MPWFTKTSGVVNGATQLLLQTGGTTRATIDSSGRLTLGYQPAFSGWRDAAGGNTGTWIMNGTHINRGNHYNTTTGVFTCPVAGAYLMAMQALGYVNAGFGYIETYKNGVLQSGWAHYSNTSGWTNPSAVCIMNCAANDTLNFNIRVSGGNTGLYSSDHNSGVFMLLG